MIYHTNVRNLMIGRGLLAALGASYAITIYGGSKPSADTITNGFASYNSGNSIFLAHYVGAVLTQSGSLASLTTIPTAVNASNTGTGAWCIIWSTNTALASMGGALPSTSFVVGDVSDGSGSGIIRFSDTSFTSGVSKAMLDGSIGASS